MAETLLGQIWVERGIAIVLAASGVVGVIGLILLVMLSRSIKRIRISANRLAQGDLTHRVPITGILPLASLAESLNKMAIQLEDRLATVMRQRNELGAVLSSMIEGVIAIDSDEHIISLNRAASALLRLDISRAIGRSIQEVIRNTTLQAFVTKTLQDNTAIQSEMIFHIGENVDDDSRHLQVQSAILHDGDGNRMGMVLVLNDITQIRRLERIRRDFVSNVSHEMKTPVSAIKAAAETIIDEQHEELNDLQRFLYIIVHQADKMNAILEDLLSLAKIEEQKTQIFSELQQENVNSVITSACESCLTHAEDKKVKLVTMCDSDLHAKMNASLIEQAIINLIDNAIKYSPSESTVRITGECQNREAVISVNDEGRGIEPKHLSRIFERFYRTDKARSRTMGGTGLGLSIVKHIAEAHGGRVSVDSLPNQGSTFRIHLALLENNGGLQPR